MIAMRRSSRARRALRTVLFTDIVGSTELAAQLGDRRWRELLRRHHERMRRALRRYGGREVDTAGDSFFAVFDEPGQAIRCALAMAEAVSPLGLTLRAGLHIGETELIDRKVGGVAVHIAARIMAQANAGEVLVSGTLSELVAGSDLSFEDRGQHELKGVPGSWRIMRVAAPPLSAEPAAEPAPRATLARRPVVIGAAAGMLVVLVGALALLAGRGPQLQAPSAAPNTVVRLDAASLAVTAAVPVGAGPAAMAGGDGVIWVANLDDQTVSRIDLAVAPPEEIARPGGVGVPVSVAAGDAGAWVADLQGTVYHVDERTNRATRVLGDRRGGSAIAAGEGWIWVLDGVRDQVLRVDPATRQLSTTVELPAGSGATAIAVGAGAVWVANSLTNSVSRIEPQAANVAVARIALCCRPSAISVGGGYVWVSSAESDSLQRVVPATNSVSLTREVGDGPVAMVADESAVWVANSLDGTILKLGPDGAELGRITLPGQPTAALLVDGSLWVALRAPAD